MQINAIYDNGSLQFKYPIQFKHARFSVKIEIPDHELVINKQEQSEIQSLTANRQTIRQQLDNILGNSAKKRQAINSAEDKAAWHQHLENKYL
ncbi:MAG: hypothetical protein KAH84_04895 [Thiomargarita sp.]|nr:hypothetical protein [Bacteroidales bacterium]MCK5719272.1 hypothetical protein [Thiomargarita sp.]